MRFKIRVSDSMASHNSILGSIEDRLIRMPLGIRSKFGLQPGLFLCLSGKNNTVVNLQVASSYLDDAVKSSGHAYVSQDTYKLLDLEKISLVKEAENILIGCDPEFFLVDRTNGTNLSANHIFAHWGDVGSDAGLAELRPRPSTTEKELVVSLDTLMRKAYYHVSNRVLHKELNIRMVGASHYNNASAGFHIHFGLPQSLLTHNPVMRSLLTYIVYVLDYYIGIASVLPEGSEDSRRRSERYSRYGKPSDYRYDMMTLEYRVPGGHLLRHPLLSSGILALSIVVIKDVLSRLKAYSDQLGRPAEFSKYEELRSLYPNLPDRSEVYRCITSEDINPALNYTGPIMTDIGNMFGYKENSESILSYFNYVLEYATGKRKINNNIEMNWRLSNERQPGEMAVL